MVCTLRYWCKCFGNMSVCINAMGIHERSFPSTGAKLISYGISRMKKNQQLVLSLLKEQL